MACRLHGRCRRFGVDPIQQYVYAQRHPGVIIDAAIPQYSYPDMVTQTIHVGDCELLEHYMDVTDGQPEVGSAEPHLDRG